MGLFSKKKPVAGPQENNEVRETTNGVSGGKTCSVSEALGDLKDNIQAKKVVELCLDLYGKDQVTTMSGSTVVISELKNKLDHMSLDEFSALNVTMSKLAEDLRNPSEDYLSAAGPELIASMRPVAEKVSSKFADYYFEKMFF